MVRKEDESFAMELHCLDELQRDPHGHNWCDHDLAEGSSPTKSAGLGDVVLLLSTSGTTGRIRFVPFSLRRLLASGAILAATMQLCTFDCGVNMMPLHHVGGITCNLIAPLISGE